MRAQKVLTLVCVVTCGMAGSAWAQPHLGIKLGAKHYQDAWLTGCKDPMYGVCGVELAAAWRRFPDDVFRDLHRDPNPQLLGVSKERRSGSATVDVQGSQGHFQVLLSGKGFNWTVQDVFTPDADRNLVSLTSMLNVASVSSEFGTELTPQRLLDKSTTQFRSQIEAWPQAFGKNTGDFMNGLEMDRKGSQVRINGNTATLTVPIGKDKSANQYIRLTLLNEGQWLVHDIECQSPTMQFASLHNALPVIAQAHRFREFADNPRSQDPREFTASGPLREELLEIRRLGKPLHKDGDGQPKLITISQDGLRMSSNVGSATIVMRLDQPAGRIREVTVIKGLQSFKLSDKLKTARSYEATVRQVSKLKKDIFDDFFSGK